MEQSFWQERWQKGEIGFNEGQPNALLVKHAAKLGRPPQRVLVPLAGKAFDLRWLAAQGHDVVGVEFVPEAITEFFKDWGTAPTPHRLGAHDAFYAKGVTLVQADIFTVTPATLNQFDVIYDRAALVALDPENRTRYVAGCRQLLRPGGGIFLVAFAYEQARVSGPPWSVDEASVRALFTGLTIEKIDERLAPANARMQASGVSNLHEAAYWIA
jgi:thiopurine S-methyltransferase